MTFLNKFSTGLLSAGILFGVLAAPVVGHAADTSNNGGSQTTDAKVNITAPSGKDGSLTIVKAPIFIFNGTSDSHQIQADSDDLIVNDGTGTASGWHVSAQMSEFSVSDGKNLGQKLTGYSLSSWTNLGAAPKLDKGEQLAGDAPVKTGWQLSADGKAANVANAVAGDGVGQWVIPFDKVVLTGNFPKLNTQYTSKMTWTLTSGPTSSVPAAGDSNSNSSTTDSPNAGK
ncbi:WxL domain-containing protein [Secundilactobacillus silagei]|uniref:WxL domain-containing protein n=1 Tax=Secundilactobacillus silagei JCM 19001 TaxID=1302250 RepID=A0A1Z5IEY5_9LACO|nr:WxL domain-containing protein [Secundilactobacillus silagei]TDG71647.1 hypothetical protein C5L25_002304 [Secundilactobacillus silagei JCM 19001]GAX00364.1 hypothetical protein IWT126_00378 [Secundilactobacillus silagei JCM 19001]